MTYILKTGHLHFYETQNYEVHNYEVQNFETQNYESSKLRNFIITKLKITKVQNFEIQNYESSKLRNFKNTEFKFNLKPKIQKTIMHPLEMKIMIVIFYNLIIITEMEISNLNYNL